MIHVFSKIIFWLTWPGLWLVLRGSRRTRLLLICGDEFMVVQGWLSNGQWSLPGGGLHKNEAPLTGVLRELREETTVILPPIQVHHAYDGHNNYQGLKFEYVAFTAILDRKPLVKAQALEIKTITWLPLKSPGVSLTQDTAALLDWWLRRD